MIVLDLHKGLHETKRKSSALTSDMCFLVPHHVQRSAAHYTNIHNFFLYFCINIILLLYVYKKHICKPQNKHSNHSEYRESKLKPVYISTTNILGNNYMVQFYFLSERSLSNTKVYFGLQPDRLLCFIIYVSFIVMSLCPRSQIFISLSF